MCSKAHHLKFLHLARAALHPNNAVPYDRRSWQSLILSARCRFGDHLAPQVIHSSQRLVNGEDTRLERGCRGGGAGLDGANQIARNSLGYMGRVI